MRKCQRGFFSIDAFFAVMLLVTISGILLSSAETTELSASWIGATQEAKMVTERMAAMIDITYSSGNGFEITFDMPTQVCRYNYVLRVDNHQKAITIENLDYNIDPSIIKSRIVCNNIENTTLSSSSFSALQVKISWDENQLKVETI